MISLLTILLDKKSIWLGNIDEGYILAPGDELRITVFGDNNLRICF